MLQIEEQLLPLFVFIALVSCKVLGPPRQISSLTAPCIALLCHTEEPTVVRASIRLPERGSRPKLWPGERPLTARHPHPHGRQALTTCYLKQLLGAGLSRLWPLVFKPPALQTVVDITEGGPDSLSHPVQLQSPEPQLVASPSPAQRVPLSELKKMRIEHEKLNTPDSFVRIRSTTMPKCPRMGASSSVI